MAAIELGVPYYIYSDVTLTNYVALNAPADAQFIGYVDDITGIDSPGVRENAQVVVAGDGGYHGPFWKDRRPWTISGFIVPSFPLVSRDQAQEKLEGIVMAAMKADGFMRWTPADGLPRQLSFRTQQPVRVTTGQSKVEKKFAVACVTADWRVICSTISNVSAVGVTPLVTPTAQNLGNADASPRFVITGPLTATVVVVTNTTTGKKITLGTSGSPITIATGTFWTIDLSGTYPTVTDSSGVDHYGVVDPLNTNWDIAVSGTVSVPSGNNVFQLDGAGSLGGNTALRVDWTHSWF